MDLIILSHEYPRESSFLKNAKEKNIPIEYPETLFFKLAPPVTPDFRFATPSLPHSVVK
jgi:hypothetical protein